MHFLYGADDHELCFQTNSERSTHPSKQHPVPLVLVLLTVPAVLLPGLYARNMSGVTITGAALCPQGF